MHEIEPGHRYELAHIDGDPGYQTICFIKRSSRAIHHDSEHPGTNTQEVLRVAIARSKYLNTIIPCAETEDAIYHLREALICYEARAWRRKQQRLNKERPAHDSGEARHWDAPFARIDVSRWNEDGPEMWPIGDDGHFVLDERGLPVL
jgi:hypothetical protein